MKKISIEDLFVVADFGYFGDPGHDGYVYFKKKHAQAVVDECKKNFPTLNKAVYDLDDFIRENREFHGR